MPLLQKVRQPEHGSPVEVFLVFLRLGCTSFGGPIAHLGYFRRELVERRGWLTEETYGEILALSQSLPGPASSQAGFAIGLLRAGMWGGVAAWAGFTLPSALLMLGFAFGHGIFAGSAGRAWLHGAQLLAVAVVAQGVLMMQRTLAAGGLRLALAMAALAIALFAPPALGTLLAMIFGAAAGSCLLTAHEMEQHERHPSTISGRTGAAAGVLAGLLLLISLAVRTSQLSALSLCASFYRTGALVFGGGHVVLPLLETAVVARGWIPQQGFLSGYGAAQALPGPLFAFAAYLGAAVHPSAHPVLFGVLALCCIFLPGLLMMTALLPWWSLLRRHARVQSALMGIHASVVGVLLAALWHPLISSTLHTVADGAIALLAFALLTVGKLQPLFVLAGTGLLAMAAAR